MIRNRNSRQAWLAALSITAFSSVSLFDCATTSLYAQSATNGLRGARPVAQTMRSIKEAEAEEAQQQEEEEQAAAPASSPDAKKMLHEAFTLSQRCSKLEEVNRIIDLCRRASSMPLAADEAAYGTNLLAWAYNRRGEMWSNDAARIAGEGHDKESARLDRKALEDFNASIRIAPDRWKALHNRGVSYGLLGLHDEAIKDFGRVIELRPEYANAWFNRAEIELEIGRYSAAIRDYTEVMKLEKDDASAVIGRAHALTFAKKYDEAVKDFAKAIELEPTQSEWRVERGEVYVRLGAWKLAATDFRSAIELDGENARAYRCAAWLMSTCPEAKFRNARLALEAAERAYALAQRDDLVDYTYLDTLAAAMANAGHFDEAKELVEEAIKESPSNAGPILRHRLSLYAAENPYRLSGGKQVVVRAASTTIKR